MLFTARTEADDVLIISLSENNLDASNVRQFKDLVQSSVGEHRHVVLDMREIKFVDSSGLGGLISLLRLLNSRNGDLRLCNLTPGVRALFELMRMHRVFNIQSSLDEAVTSYA